MVHLKKHKRGLFKDLREGEGPLGNFAPPSSTSRRGKTEEGPRGAGGHGLAALGAWRRPGIGGKGAGRRRDSIPLLNFRGGGLQGRSHGSEWCPAAGVRGGGAAGLGGGQGEGKKH